MEMSHEKVPIVNKWICKPKFKNIKANPDHSYVMYAFDTVW